MLDDDDLGVAELLVWIATDAGLAVTAIAIAIFLAVAITVANNKDICSRLHCSAGMEPKLMAHECLCVEPAR